MMTSVDTVALQALADPLRIRIVSLLAQEELCVCHLVEETGAKQTNISNHLRLLREAGLVEREASGRFMYYRLRPEALDALAGDLGRLASDAKATTAENRKRPC